MATRKKKDTQAAHARFIESMECLPVAKLPQGPDWSYEIKLDGFRLGAVKAKGAVTLYSRRGNVLNRKFHYIATALKTLPDNTVLDGELVALDENGKSDFGLLQNFRSAESKIHYYVFDMLILKSKDVSHRPLDERRALFDKIIPRNAHISPSAVEHGSYARLLKFVRNHGLEGIIAKRSDSPYEPGKRSGLWQKYRLNLQQEFVIGGYTRGGLGFDALIIGFYRGKELIFAARVRAGFIPATRRAVFEQIKGLKISRCPFVNLPQKEDGRWGQGRPRVRPSIHSSARSWMTTAAGGSWATASYPERWMILEEAQKRSTATSWRSSTRRRMGSLNSSSRTFARFCPSTRARSLTTSRC